MAENNNKQEKKPAKGQDKAKTRSQPARRGRGLAAVQGCIKWISAARAINDIFAEFESHWLGGEFEGDKYLPAEAAFFATSSRRGARPGQA